MADWRPNKGITYNTWRDCDICGSPWPRKELRRQNGLLVCPEDFDDMSNEDFQREDGDLAKDTEGAERVWDIE